MGCFGIFENIDLSIVFSSLLAAAIAVAGWIVGHKLSDKRSLQDTLRQIRRKYLMEATEALLEASLTGSVTKNHKEIQRAVFLIQVYGDKKLVSLFEKFVSDISNNGESEYTDLFVGLRDKMRGDVGLQPLGKRIHLLKIELKK